MMFHVVVLAFAACLVCLDGTYADDHSNLTPGTPSAAQSLLHRRSLPFLRGPSVTDFCPYTTGKKICCNPPGTCLAGSECCNANVCCVRGFRCCNNGQWCCKNTQRCGPYFNTCQN